MIGTPVQLPAASTLNTVAVADAHLALSSKLKSFGGNPRFQAVVGRRAAFKVLFTARAMLALQALY